MGTLLRFLASAVAAGTVVSISATSVWAAEPGAVTATSAATVRAATVVETPGAPPAGTPAARLEQLNAQFEQATAELERLDQRLAEDEKRQADITATLAGFARLQYEQQGPLLRLLGAGSLNQVMGDIAQDRLVSDRQRALLQEARVLRVRDRGNRDDAAAELAVIKAGREEAQRIAEQAKIDEALRLQALALAQAQEEAAARAARPASQQQEAPGSLQSVPTSGPNRFAYGYCTWYVANRRYTPWLGNAGDWWPNARSYGYAEGQTPVVGAVMVTWESGYGHVAYVESVNADGSWTVSEMNFHGWNVITSRTVRRGQVPLIGFIYGKG